jgi:hypothetical protein
MKTLATIARQRVLNDHDRRRDSGCRRRKGPSGGRRLHPPDEIIFADHLTWALRARGRPCHYARPLNLNPRDSLVPDWPTILHIEPA